MPDDVLASLLYVAAAIAVLAAIWKGGAALLEAKARRVRGHRPIGEERLKAYAAMVEAGTPAAAADAALSSLGPPAAAAPLPPPPVGPSSGPESPSSPKPTGVLHGSFPASFPDPHLLERIRALEAKVAALEAQVGAPAAADLQGMRAPRPGGDATEAARPAGLRAFP